MINLFELTSAEEREPTPAEQAALGWVVRCASGLPPEHDREFRCWLGDCSQHQALFDEFFEMWAIMTAVPESPANIDRSGGRDGPPVAPSMARTGQSSALLAT